MGEYDACPYFTDEYHERDPGFLRIEEKSVRKAERHEFRANDPSRFFGLDPADLRCHGFRHSEAAEVPARDRRDDDPVAFPRKERERAGAENFRIVRMSVDAQDCFFEIDHQYIPHLFVAVRSFEAPRVSFLRVTFAGVFLVSYNFINPSKKNKRRTLRTFFAAAVLPSTCRGFYLPDFSNFTSFVFFVRFVVDSSPFFFPLRGSAFFASSALKNS